MKKYTFDVDVVFKDGSKHHLKKFSISSLKIVFQLFGESPFLDYINIKIDKNEKV